MERTSDAAEMEARQAGKPSPKARLRTLDDLDRRTKAAQQALALRDALAADLGGWEHITTAERQLVEGVALLGAMIRDAGAAYLSGRPIDLGEFMALTNAQRRLLADIGLQRRARDVTPSIADLRAEAAA